MDNDYEKDLRQLNYMVAKYDSYKAMTYAMEKHANQKRKYTGEPYWVHLSQVAGLISTIYQCNMVKSIAWLHDVVEDTETTLSDILRDFDDQIMMGVGLLSDLEQGNRDTRKRLSRERLAKVPAYIQDIKVCDLISNTSSIVLHDPKFAKVYLEEKRLLLECLDKADKRLLELAYKQIL